MTSASAPLRRAGWVLAGGCFGLLAVVAVPALFDLNERAALLVVVEDARAPDSPPDRARGEEARADAVMLLQPATGSRRTTSVTSLPRDLVLVPGAEPITIGFGTRGAKQLGVDVAAALSVDVAAVAVIDLADVARLADSIGPVTVELGAASRDIWTGFSGGPGSVALDGSRAVAYLRSRHWEEQDADATWVSTGGGDRARQERLHRFLAAAVAHLESVGTLGQLRLGAGLLGRARLYVLHPTALPQVGRGLAATRAVTFTTLAVRPERPLDELRSPFAPEDVGGARNLVLGDMPRETPRPITDRALVSGAPRVMTAPSGRVDVFVSYRHGAPTASWVRGDLVDALEAEGFRVIVDVRDFRPAGILVEEMEEASRRARVTVAVVDETYAQSGFTDFERTISPQLVVVAKGAVARDQLPPARLTVDLRDTDDVRPVVDAVHSLITRVYVLEAEQDQAWVEGVLLPALEIADVSVGHSLHVAAGAVKADAVVAAFLRADRVIAVLSRAYLRGVLDTVVATVALEQQVEKLLPVRLEAGLDLPKRYTVREVIDASETDRWGAAVARICDAIGVTPPVPPGPPPCPYPGMRPFSDSDEDADLFVGRGPEIAETLRVLRRSRIAVIIGPSGSGKSSLALAGVVPRLRLRGVHDQTPAVVCVMRPGPQPAQAFDQALATVQRIDAVPQPPGATGVRDRVVVIDQLEEAFSPEQRDPRSFLRKLVDAHRADPHLHLVVTVRADFVGSLMSDRPLWALIAAHRVEVTPLAGDALRDAIRRPARERGVVVEEALVERLASETEGEPGLLPFLQETLRRLWDDLEWRLMTLDSYRQLGRRADGGSGVLEAIRDEAERALAEATALRPDAEPVVRAILLRLVQFGEGAPHTRRQQTLADLEGAAPDAATFEAMFGVLQAHRIITSSALGRPPAGSSGELQVADLSHEAIIRGWPKLERWVTTHQVLERDRRRWLQRAQVWSAGQGSLLADHDLSVAQTWATDAAAAGIRVDDLIARHLRASRDRAVRSARRRRATVLGSVVVLALLATTFGLLARSSRAAQRAAEEEADRRVAIQLQTSASAFEAGVAVPALLARAADVIEPTPLSAVEMLSTLERLPPVSAHIDATKPGVGFEAFVDLDDGLLVGDGVGGLYRYRDGDSEPVAEQQLGHGILALARSPTSGLVAVAGGDSRPAGETEACVQGALWLVDPDDPTLSSAAVPLADHCPFSAALFVGSRLFVGSWSGRVYEVDTTVPSAPTVRAPLELPLRQDTAEAPPCSTDASDRSVRSLAVDEDERFLVASANNCLIAQWDLVGQQPRPTLVGHTDKVRAVAFVPGTAELLSTGDDRTIRSWDLDRGDDVGRVLVERADGQRAIAMCIAPDGASVVTAGRDHDVRRWPRKDRRLDEPPMTFPGHSSTIRALQCLTANRFASVAGDGVIEWDADRVSRSARHLALPGQQLVRGAAVRPGGQADVAVANVHHLAVHRPGATEPVELVLGEDTQLDALAYSPDGRLLAVTGRADDRAVVVVYDADRLQSRRRVDVGDVTPGGVTLPSVAVTDDGDVVAGSDVGTLVIDRGGVRADIDLGQDRAVLTVAVGPGGELLAGDSGGTLFCVAGDGGIGRLHLPRAMNSLAVSDDGTVAVGTADGALGAFPGALRPRDGAETDRAADDTRAPGCAPAEWQQTGLPQRHDRIDAVGLALGGELLLAATSDATLELWDLPRARLMGSIALPADASGVGRHHVAVDPGATTIAITNGSALDAFNLDRPRLRAQLCELAGRELTPDEVAAFVPGGRHQAAARCSG